MEDFCEGGGGGEKYRLARLVELFCKDSQSRSGFGRLDYSSFIEGSKVRYRGGKEYFTPQYTFCNTG